MPSLAEIWIRSFSFCTDPFGKSAPTHTQFGQLLELVQSQVLRRAILVSNAIGQRRRSSHRPFFSCSARPWSSPTSYISGLGYLLFSRPASDTVDRTGDHVPGDDMIKSPFPRWRSGLAWRVGIGVPRRHARPRSLHFSLSPADPVSSGSTCRLLTGRLSGGSLRERTSRHCRLFASVPRVRRYPESA
jgi:hypothetical protein